MRIEHTRVAPLSERRGSPIFLCGDTYPKITQLP